MFPALFKKRVICVLLGTWQIYLHGFAFFFLSNFDITLLIYKRVLLESMFLFFYLILSFLKFCLLIVFPLVLVLGSIGYYCNAHIRLKYKKFIY